MPNLPESWGLSTNKRSDGRLDIVGKTDAGESYTVRTTDGPEITSRDITELHDADREAYSGDRAKQFMDKLISQGKRREQEHNDAFGDGLVDAAGEVAFAGLERRGHSSPFTGSTRAYRVGWDRAFGKEN